MRPGYKQTDVGVIPEEWEICPVAKKGEVLTGKALAVNAPGRQRPYLRTMNVFDGRIDIDDVLTMPMSDEQFAQFEIRKGDVLLNEGQSLELVGRCAMYRGEYPEPCAIQNQLLRFRAKAAVSGLFASHLFRYCQQTGVFARIALQTTSIAHLGGSRFARLLLVWPKSETEQHAIAEALSDVDAVLDALDRLIVKKRDLKQAAMQQLLTGQTRLPGFSTKWEVGELASVIGALDTGVSVNSVEHDSDGSDGMRILKTSAVAEGRFIPHECKRIAARDLARACLNPRNGSIIISRMNTPDLVGECGYVDRDYPNLFVPDRLWMTRFKPDVHVSGQWLSYLLSTAALKRQVRAAATGTSGSMKNLSKRAFLQIPIALPSGPEQAAIAVVLSDMDAELVALEGRRDKTRDLKQAMMQELLTGRTRLV